MSGTTLTAIVAGIALTLAAILAPPGTCLLWLPGLALSAWGCSRIPHF